MSLRTIGYVDGKPIKVDEGPSGHHGDPRRLGGEMVIGGDIFTRGGTQVKLGGECGATLRLKGTLCKLGMGHRGDHRDQEAIDRKNERRAAERARKREYYQQNREAILAHQREYWYKGGGRERYQERKRAA